MVCCLVGLSIGVFVTSLDLMNMMWVFAVGAIGVAFLDIRINYRNKNYVGIFMPTRKGLTYPMTKLEKNIAAVSISILASPFAYILGLLAYERAVL